MLSRRKIKNFLNRDINNQKSFTTINSIQT